MHQNICPRHPHNVRMRAILDPTRWKYSPALANMEKRQIQDDLKRLKAKTQTSPRSVGNFSDRKEKRGCIRSTYQAKFSEACYRQKKVA